MKNKVQYLFGLLIVGAFLAMAFGNSEQYKVGEYYRYVPSADTITNAEKDTLLLPVTMYSQYTYCIQGVRTSLSGTHNVKFVLQQSNTTTGNTDWVGVDSTSTTTATIGLLQGAELYGVRYRILVNGSGTQSSRYALNCTFKKKN